MSTSLTKYSKNYMNLMRTDISNYFRKGSFLREHNIENSSIYKREMQYSVSQ